MTEKRQKILIVDDKKQNLLALRRILADVDADIVEATSGNQALAATLDYDFAVAILDVMMPGMDGYELAEHLRGDAKTRRIPIIFLTAIHSEEERIFKGYDVGAVDYIIKPYNPDVLLAKVRVFLEMEKARAELAEKIVALIASEDRYRSLVTTIPDIVYRIDTDGRFTYLNEAVEVLGYTPENLLGSHFSKILLPADVENVSRDMVLPKYKGKTTGPEDAPKLFDERRTGKRKTKGLEVCVVPRQGGRALPAEIHRGGLDIIVEINSSGIYGGKPDGRKRVSLGTVGIIRDITERKRAEEELAKHRDNLEILVRERVKEQACLYSISKVLGEPHKTVDNALHQVVNLIPSGLQYPDIACARLCLDDRTVTSEPFRENQWRLASDIVVQGKTRGTVEVFHMEEQPVADQGPFLKEEKDLITGIARIFGQAVERMEAIAREQHLNAILRGIRNVNQLILREKNRDRLIQRTCSGLVRDRAFNGIWIVLTNRVPEGVKAAHFGFSEKPFSELVNLFKKGELPACCRRFQADPGIIMTTNPALDCEGCPLTNEYRENAGLLTTLEYQGKRFGYMGLSVSAQFAEDEEELSLLEEISGDIAFALYNIESETARKKSERMLETMFESARDGILLSDARTRQFLRANTAMIRMLGYNLEEITGLSVDDIHPSEDLPHIIAEFEKQLRCETGLSLDIPVKCKDGSVFFADVNITFLELDRRPHILCIFRDITDRKRAEQELRDAELEKRLILDTQSSQVVLQDLSFSVTWANRSACESAGLSREEIIGRHCYEIWAQRDDICPGCPVALGIKTGRTQEIVRKISNGRTWHIVGSPVRDEAGRIVSTVLVTEDITERVTLESQLRQSQRMEAIGTLAGGIAHDFNNILTSVIGFTQLALDDVEKGTSLEDNLQEVYTAGNRAKDLVKQILTFTRQTEEEIKPVYIHLIAKEVLKLLRSSIPTTIEIRQNIKSESLIMANPSQVHQIFMNLCTNAAQAMDKDGGILEVTLADVKLDHNFTRGNKDLKPGNYLKIVVSDTGIGIGPDVIESIFEPYFTTKELGEGTGMGLAMVHGIVKGYEGEVTVDSTVGIGTVFSVYLPVAKKRSESQLYEDEELPAGTERILIVDDELPIVKMSSRILERSGYDVTTHTDSLEALELFRSRPGDFDLVITDMTMPGMTGDKLAVEMIKIRPDIPVILCTGYSKKISDETASEVGIKAFAYKPIVKADLVKTVRKVLDGAKGRTQQ